MASPGALPVCVAFVALLGLPVGRLAPRIAAAALPGTRLLRAAAALPGGGRLISAGVVLLPRPHILIGRLLPGPRLLRRGVVSGHPRSSSLFRPSALWSRSFGCDWPVV